jgi:hypothetical protein
MLPDLTKNEKFSVEDWLSMDLIRSHTKTDDIASVTDEQMEIYRAAAVEAAEMFTGMILGPLRQVEERVAGDGEPRNYSRRFMTYRLKHRVYDGIVYWAGHAARGTAQTVNDYKVKLPAQQWDAECCNTCGTNSGLELRYRTGFKCVDDIPAMIKLGCLKYIAWSVQNTGDELVTMLASRTPIRGTNSGVGGTNDVAWASGAVELWRKFRIDY